MTLERGMVQVHTEGGKGKTTASLGLALRAAGSNLTVCMVQFMKGGGLYGEHLAAGLDEGDGRGPLLANLKKMAELGFMG